MIELKSAREIELIRESGIIAANSLQYLEQFVVPGISTGELNDLADAYIRKFGAIPSSLNYHGFPKSLCTSVNNVIVHGIPGKQKLKDGDIITIDITAFKNGYHGDTARTYMVGNVSKLARKLVNVTKEALDIGIKYAKVGNRLGDIGHAIEVFVKKNHFSTVRDFTGHGIGRGFHEPPQVLHYGKPHTGLRLEVGLVFTIEPMINAGTHKMKILNDGWTAITADGALAAQFEHTIAITKTGTEVLTLPTI